MKFEELELMKVGNEIFLSGAIYSDQKYHYLCFFPDMDDDKDRDGFRPIVRLEMNLEQWKKFIRQTDLQEVEVINHSSDGKITKAILRKTARLMDSKIMWKVYNRDEYTCRYCGAEGVPLTVDHIITWETGGPTIEENLLTACRKCNKIRGNMPYELWIESDEYEKLSDGIPRYMKEHNKREVDKLNNIPRVSHIRSR